MTHIFDPGSKFYLGFAVPLEKYLTLAAKPLPEQQDESNIRVATGNHASFFANKANRVRAFYDRLRSKELSTYDRDKLARRSDSLGNVYFMRELGLISPRTPEVLAEILGNEKVPGPVDLSLSSLDKLQQITGTRGDSYIRDLTFDYVKSDRPVAKSGVAIELHRIITALGGTPRFSLPFDPEALSAAARAAFIHAQILDADITKLFARTASSILLNEANAALQAASIPTEARPHILGVSASALRFEP